MPREYQQHRPESTLLYGIVRDHLLEFLDRAREQYRRGLPRYVEDELRAYLRCGIHAHGFARAVCRECGHELLVAFSCKKRGICPSCNVRRMCDTAARLVDRVLPDVRLRQWVLSIPFGLRLLLAKDPDCLSAFGRIFVQEVFRWQRSKALLLGHDAVHLGAIDFPQRFGGSLNLNVHFHLVVPDAVYVEGLDGLELVHLRAPSQLDLDEVAHNTAVRALRWLERHGHLRAPAEAPSRSPSLLDACLESSLGTGGLVRLKTSGKTESVASATGHSKKTSRLGDFDIHAGVSARTLEERERLIRYCARPPLSLQRLSVTRDGQIAYELKRPIRGATHRLLTPLAFLARLCALIPPPRHPLIRFHGLFAPHSALRAQAVRHAPLHKPEPLPPPATPSPSEPHDERTWESNRLDWATLLRRVHDVDALACPCGGRLRFVQLVTTLEEARPFLIAHGLPSELAGPAVQRGTSPADFYDSTPGDAFAPAPSPSPRSRPPPPPDDHLFVDDPPRRLTSASPHRASANPHFGFGQPGRSYRYPVLEFSTVIPCVAAQRDSPLTLEVAWASGFASTIAQRCRPLSRVPPRRVETDRPGRRSYNA